MRSEYIGNIEPVRAVEDAIRATRKYTEGVLTQRHRHPVQGSDFTSRSFWKHYEVYPETELSWDMPASAAMDWLWASVPCITVAFLYHYRDNKAWIIVKGGQTAILMLGKGIPGFSEALAKVPMNGYKER